MRMSDLITKEIIKMLNESEENIAEIQRNEFAGLIGCAPSQINYVLSSRFTPEHGYIIESRRGGGGYIRIKRVVLNQSSAFMHIINSIGSRIDSMSTRIVIENCLEAGLISRETAALIAAALSESVMQTVPPEYKDTLRAAILKQMLLTLI
ncbi:MAG: CtsR family transcriptional regulator [Clostridia bacterium]|nr:CtsR family transcriptional regulator [Clostridia bacterium]